jgi:hypothetical protein
MTDAFPVMISIGGTGHHTSTLPPSTRSIALKLAVGTKIICPMSTSFSKLGVLVFLHRILRHAGRGYRIAIRTTFVAISMTVLAQFVYPFVNCRPFRKTWIPQTPGVCSIEDLDLWRYAGIPNTVTTVMVVAIPLPAMVKLQVSREVRFGLGVVFAVCVAGLVAAFMRFYSFLMVTSSHDITYENVRPMCWIVAESGTYLIAGVMLTLRPMLGKMWKATAVEKMWVGSGSRSWGSIRVSRKQSRRQALEVTPNIRTQQSLSVERKDSKLQQSLSMERKDILLPDIPRVYRTSEHWFEKSAKL